MAVLSKEPQVIPGEKGWIETTPLEKYASIHELSLAGLMGFSNAWPDRHFFIQFDFNMHTPFQIDPKAYLSFHTQDADKAPALNGCCYSISEFNRWRLNIEAFSTFDEYLSSLIRWHRCNYSKSEKSFKKMDCEISIISGDWSEYVDAVYRLYTNVARKHGHKLYDRHYFEILAKREDSLLISAWHKGEMIGHFVLIEELPTLHSICCGLDYERSSESYSYSWLHYELVRFAIQAQKYHNIDVGLTADNSKKLIGFVPVLSRMDLYTNGVVTRGLLRVAHAVSRAKITPDAKVKFHLR